ncbi:MAG: peptidoglycan DD-metalloendopeptidase family protein [Prochlorothrix sp.]
MAMVSKNPKAILVASTAQFQPVMVANAVTPNRTRRARSAAMVGLAALSMGAADLSSFWNTKGALAADDAVATEPLRRFSEDDPEPSTTSFSGVANPTLATPAVQPLGASFSGFEAETIAAEPTLAEIQGFGGESKITHVVVAGESWGDIAEHYGITVQALAMANALPLDSNLAPGQILRIPAIVELPALETAQIFTDVPLVSSPAASEPLPVAFLPERQETDATVAIGGQAPVPNLLKGDLETLKVEPKATAARSSNPASNAAPVIAAAPAATSTTLVPHWELADLIPYRVQPGDTLDKIARDHAVPRAALVEVNKLQNPNQLMVNQLLGIPREGAVELTASALGLPEFSEVHGGNAADAADVPTLAGVFSGETQATSANPVLLPESSGAPNPIASLGTPNASPATADLPVVPIVGLTTPTSNSGVAEGAVPRVAPAMVAQPAAPQGATSTVVAAGLVDPANAANLYAVQPGDTLFSIARNHGVSVHSLAQHNSISNPNQIFVSQRLNIPGSLGAVASTASLTASVPQVATTVATTSLMPGLGYGVTPGVAPESPSPNLNAPSRPAAQPQASELSPHIQGLLSEIEALRAKYRAAESQPVAGQGFSAAPTTPQAFTSSAPAPQAASPVAPAAAIETTAAALQAPAPQAAPEVALLPVNERVNPEFRGPSTPAIDPNISVSAPLQTRTPEPVVAPLSAEEQLLAAAPIGAENYDPLVQSLLGQQVSPQLPAVGADPFLPDSVANGFIWPAQGMLTSGYGWRWGRMHKGIDIAAPVGTPIVAAAGGVVSYAGWNSGGYGNLVEIQHPDGSVTLYAHNSRIMVQEGQRVSQGQRIADMGSTGYSTGPHLHFEIHPSGQGAVNPMAYLPR